MFVELVVVRVGGVLLLVDDEVEDDSDESIDVVGEGGDGVGVGAVAVG